MLQTKGYILDKQTCLFGQPRVVGFGDDSFEVRAIDRDTANRVIKENHYSRKFYTASYIHLGAFKDGDMIGVLQFGYAMNPASQASVVAGTAIDEYLELNRMWMDDAAPRNTESKAIGYAIKYIKRAYPKVAWIQSFADERCGRFGVVYQAANFEYYGEHDSVFWELDGEVYHHSLMERAPELSRAAAHIQANRDRATQSSYRQFRYIYWIKRQYKKRVCLDQKPYPKPEEGSPP